MASKIYGDWAKVKKFTRNFPQTLKASLDEAEAKEAEEVRQAITDAIIGQELSHAPLKPDTIRRKGHSDILVDTGAFAHSFTVEDYGGDKIIYPKGNTDTGITMAELAIYHEYGTRKMPPRPTIRPVYEKMKGEVQEDLIEVVENEINKYR